MITIKTMPFRFPNYIALDLPGEKDDKRSHFSVADLFPTDEDAQRYWDELKQQWVDHVNARRAAGKESKP